MAGGKGEGVRPGPRRRAAIGGRAENLKDTRMPRSPAESNPAGAAPGPDGACGCGVAFGGGRRSPSR